MNIHFEDKVLFEILVRNSLTKVKIGSHLYGTNNENSDEDYLYIYLKPKSLQNSFLWEHHQLQYKENGIDHNFTDLHSFIRNIMTGDATINFEVLHSREFETCPMWFLSEKRHWFYSYNIIRSYLGLARRDLKYVKKGMGWDYKKLYHAVRGYHAACHIRNGDYSNSFGGTESQLYRTLRDMKNGLSKRNSDEIVELYSQWIKEMRELINHDLENGKLDRVMSVDKMKIIDNWLVEFTEQYQKEFVTIPSYFYKALEEGIKY